MEWASERKNEWTNEQTNWRTGGRTNERTDERTNERTNGRTNKRTNGRTDERTNERTNKRTNEQTNERQSIDNQLLSSCQSGFRFLHSTLTALLEATNSWSVNIDNGFLNGVVFIDLKTAFDTIDHEIILRKLSYFGADQATAKWFQSYL